MFIVIVKRPGRLPQRLGSASKGFQFIPPGKPGAHKFNDEAEAEAVAKQVRDLMAKQGSTGTVTVEPIRLTPSLKAGIAWVAAFDEGSSHDIEVIAGLPTVLLLEELFGKDRNEIAQQVLALRLKG